MKKIFASFGWMLLLLPLINVAGVRTAYIMNTSFADARQVSGFNGIASGGAFKIYIQFGQKEGIRLEGDEDAIKEIETVVENGILKIRYKKRTGHYLEKWQNTSRSNVNIYVTAISLTSLISSGSGDIEVREIIKAEKLQTNVSGSGSISLTMSAGTYSATISGSGKITASGFTQRANVAISGSGKFRGRDLKTSNSDVKVSGSGNATIFASNTLNAALSGSGEIKYSGNAKVTANKSGSGSISRI